MTSSLFRWACPKFVRPQVIPAPSVLGPRHRPAVERRERDPDVVLRDRLTYLDTAELRRAHPDPPGGLHEGEPQPLSIAAEQFTEPHEETVDTSGDAGRPDNSPGPLGAARRDQIIRG
jgi:hypothetical protein